MAIWNSLGKYRDTGLLILRVGLGVMMIMHGLPKLQGGPELWAGVGKSMGNIGIHFMPTFWGFMAAGTLFQTSGIIARLYDGHCRINAPFQRRWYLRRIPCN